MSGKEKGIAEKTYNVIIESFFQLRDQDGNLTLCLDPKTSEFNSRHGDKVQVTWIHSLRGMELKEICLKS